MMHLAMRTLWNRTFIAEVLTNCCAPLALVRGKSFTFLRIMLFLAEGASRNRAIARLMLSNHTTIVTWSGSSLVTNQNLVMLTAGLAPVLCIIDAVLGLMTKSLTILTLPTLIGGVTPALAIGARATVSLIMSSLVAGFTCQLGEALFTIMAILIANITQNLTHAILAEMTTDNTAMYAFMQITTANLLMALLATMSTRCDRVAILALVTHLLAMNAWIDLRTISIYVSNTTTHTAWVTRKAILSTFTSTVAIGTLEGHFLES
jgi:hypothetical protein